MISNRSLARIAGVLYLIVAGGGGFAQSVRTSVRVAGDPAATSANLVQNATVFRAALAADLVAFVAFLGVGIVLYVLLKDVNAEVALAMLLLNAVSVAMTAINLVGHAAALLVTTGTGYGAGSASMALLILDLHQQGYLVSQVFFGLYLLPLGYLVYRSSWFPKALGIILMAGAVGYVAGVAAAYLSPTLESTVATYLGVSGGVAEILFLLWLIVFSARDRALQSLTQAKGVVA